jgi:DNA repair exonuclease SbcCD ATPase subunit
MASEAHLRRSASRKARAGLRKRPASLRRAFNHIFGSDPLGQDQDKSIEQKFEQTLASQVEPLQKELTQCRKNLEEARATVLSQDEEISTLEQRSARLEAKLEENKTVLIRQKTALEEGMVAVVVQQINDARKTEREAVRAKCEREHQTTLVSPSNLMWETCGLVNRFPGESSAQAQVANCLYIARSSEFDVFE